VSLVEGSERDCVGEWVRKEGDAEEKAAGAFASPLRLRIFVTAKTR
jgi:hypothetical protein